MMEKATMVLMLAGIYFLGRIAVVTYIAKNIIRWLRH